MGHKKLVTILIFFFHLNLSSEDSINLELLSNDETTSIQTPSNLQLFSNDQQNETTTSAVSLQMETFSVTNHPKSELYYRLIYPSERIFREFIVSTLNSEKICELYRFFHSKDSSISYLKFLPAERFFKTHAVITTENEQKIVYNFQFGEEKNETQFFKFTPIVYNRTDNTLEAINPYFFSGFETTPDGCPVANIGKEFFPFRQELNTKHQNKTVMIATTEKKYKNFILILEDSTNKNYSVICYGRYNEERNENKAILLFDSRYYYEEDIEYPTDINFILKAKYMSGLKKYAFKFQFGHIKFCQKFLKNIFCLIVRLDNAINDARTRLRKSNLTILQKVFEYFFIVICFLIQAYTLMAPYKALIGAVFSPLYFYYSPKIFFLIFNLEPLIAAFFFGPTLVYRDLQMSRHLKFPKKQFRIYPIDQMFAINTLKKPYRVLILTFFFAWFIMFVFTSFVYCFLGENKIPGEFLE